MTREETIRMFRNEIECLSHTKCKDCMFEKDCDLMQSPTDDKYIEAYAKAIKALEQEPILDKIRAEIEQNAYPIVHGVNNHEMGMTLFGILQVIDKYKTESESSSENRTSEVRE